MEILIFEKGKLYRIDGASNNEGETVYEGVFYGEEVTLREDDHLNYLENYQPFRLHELIDNCTEAIKQATTVTPEEEYDHNH